MAVADINGVHGDGRDRRGLPWGAITGHAGYTVGTSAAQLTTTIPDTATRLMLVNDGASTVYVGNSSSVTDTGANRGLPLPQNSSLTLALTEGWAKPYLIASSSQEITVAWLTD